MRLSHIIKPSLLGRGPPLRVQFLGITGHFFNHAPIPEQRKKNVTISASGIYTGKIVLAYRRVNVAVGASPTRVEASQLSPRWGEGSVSRLPIMMFGIESQHPSAISADLCNFMLLGHSRARNTTFEQF